MCIGKLMTHTLFLNRAGIYRSKLQNAVHFRMSLEPELDVFMPKGTIPHAYPIHIVPFSINTSNELL